MSLAELLSHCSNRSTIGPLQLRRGNTTVLKVVFYVIRHCRFLLYALYDWVQQYRVYFTACTGINVSKQSLELLKDPQKL